MRTFKEIQDDVLTFIGDEGDTGTMLDVVKDGIKYAHQELLTEQMYDFMLWPQIETLSIEAGRKNYTLHPLYMQGLWFYDTTRNIWLQEVPIRGQYELGTNPHDAQSGSSTQFMLTSLMPVKRQPLDGGSVITVTTTGGTEAASSSITVQGTDSNGDYTEETLSSGSTWSTITGGTTFVNITGITKNGTAWTRTITLTDSGTNTLLSLTSSERGKQYRQLELPLEPSSALTWKYRFYQRPRLLVDDYDTIQVPIEFDQILVYRTLIHIAGYTRPTEVELETWSDRVKKLEFNMKSTYTQTRTLGGRPRYVNYVERT